MWIILLLFVLADAISINKFVNKIKSIRVNPFKLLLQIQGTNNNDNNNLDIALLNKTEKFYYFGILLDPQRWLL